jgi:hypothetical protein
VVQFRIPTADAYVGRIRRRRTTMRRRWMLIGGVLLGGGLAGISLEDSHHNACNAGLGPFGSLTGGSAHHCGFYNGVFLVAIVTAVVGLAVTVAALMIRS